MINLQKFFDIVDFRIFHKIAPFEIKDEDDNTGRVEWADQDYAGITIGDEEEEITFDNLGWLYITDLHDVMKSIWFKRLFEA